MLLHLFLTILFFTISLEGCVRMIPPEEVTISSTSATVPTHAPSRPTPEGSTEATTVQTEAPTSNEPPTTETPTDRESIFS